MFNHIFTIYLGQLGYIEFMVIVGYIYNLMNLVRLAVLGTQQLPELCEKPPSITHCLRTEDPDVVREQYRRRGRFNQAI